MEGGKVIDRILFSYLNHEEEYMKVTFYLRSLGLSAYNMCRVVVARENLSQWQLDTELVQELKQNGVPAKRITSNYGSSETEGGQTCFLDNYFPLPEGITLEHAKSSINQLSGKTPEEIGIIWEACGRGENLTDLFKLRRLIRMTPNAMPAERAFVLGAVDGALSAATILPPQTSIGLFLTRADGARLAQTCRSANTMAKQLNEVEEKKPFAASTINAAGSASSGAVTATTSTTSVVGSMFPSVQPASLSHSLAGVSPSSTSTHRFNH